MKFALIAFLFAQVPVQPKVTISPPEAVQAQPCMCEQLMNCKKFQKWLSEAMDRAVESRVPSATDAHLERRFTALKMGERLPGITRKGKTK